MTLAFIASPATAFKTQCPFKTVGKRCTPPRFHWVASAQGMADENDNTQVDGWANINDQPQLPPKRKRGRPRGSKNRKFGNEATRSGVTPLRAPNGLPGSGPEDLLPELLPLLAQQEMEEMEEESANEISVRSHLEDLMAEFSSKNQKSDRLQNLRPYALRTDAVICDACNGEGMTTCSYCKGEGFVDFGEDNKRFHDDFPDGDMVLPKRVMENIYHCPMCGGLQKERCIKCLGVGELEDTETKKPKGASSSPLKDKFWERMDFEAIMAEASDRVEVGVDGLMIMRAPARKGRSGRPRKQKAADSEENNGTEHADESSKQTQDMVTEQMDVSLKKKRGRPRKTKIGDASVAPTNEINSELGDTEIQTDTSASSLVERETLSKKKRGRPRKAESPEPDFDLVPNFSSIEREDAQLESPRIGRGRQPKSSLNKSKSSVAQRTTGSRFAKKEDEQPSTDFVNTTDYQVGRQLRKLAARDKKKPKDT